jgi:succinyl-CoA synthetase beta subunit
MKLHEYQAKDLLRRHGVKVPPGEAAHTVADAVAAAKSMGGTFFVVKAMVHAGGRGKGRFKEAATPDVLEQVLVGAADVPGKGGVQLCGAGSHDDAVAKVQAAAEMMLGNTLVTKQTGIEGVKVKTVLVTTGAEIKTELYAAVLLDRSTSRLVLMASTEGGTEIEEVAEKTPEKILKAAYSPETGLSDEDAERLARGIGIPDALIEQAKTYLQGLSKIFCELDCSLAEINPLVTTKDGKVLALDAKMNFDDNALFRHSDLVELRDLDEEDAKEIEASKYDLSYISLDGDIGCMVNGAGLAMSTMDVIQLYGGSPANFLDVGGGATAEKVAAAFRIILSDDNVKAVLVNIFGGIMKCDVIAEGVITAVKEVSLDVPLVVRLEGTNVERGKALLAESGLPIISADDLDDAAQKVCATLK